MDRDLQLSMYHLAAREVWGIEPERLTLYYLLPGQRMTTVRTPDGHRRAPPADRDRRRTDRGREVRAQAEPALRLVRLPAAVPAVPPPVRARGGRPHTEDDRDRGRVDRPQARGLGGVPAPRGAQGPDQRVLRGAWLPEAVRDRRERPSTAARSTSPRRTPAGSGPILEPLGLWEQVLAVDPKRLSDLIESRRLAPDVEDALLASREEVRTQHALYLKEPARARR